MRNDYQNVELIGVDTGKLSEEDRGILFRQVEAHPYFTQKEQIYAT